MQGTLATKNHRQRQSVVLSSHNRELAIGSYPESITAIWMAMHYAQSLIRLLVKLFAHENSHFINDVKHLVQHWSYFIGDFIYLCFIQFRYPVS